MPQSRDRYLIVGTEFTNQGAHLMLLAAADAVREVLGGEPTVDFRVGTPSERKAARVSTLVPVRLERLLMGRLARFLPESVFGFVLPRGIRAVIDASGFRYGDAWKSLDLSSSAERYERFQRNSVPVFLVPQALGPFERTSAESKRVLLAASVVWARDPDSFDHATRLVEGSAIRPNVLQSPDFTILVDGTMPKKWSRSVKAVPVVPNWNIVKRARTAEDESAYIANLAAIVDRLRELGFEPYGLVHERAGDKEVLVRVGEALKSGGLDIVDGLGPAELKYVLGVAPVVVSGRYHALVSALTHGVPVVAHGWSHKYRWLLEDFGCAESIASPYDSVVSSLEHLERVIDGTIPFPKEESARSYERSARRVWGAISQRVLSNG